MQSQEKKEVDPTSARKRRKEILAGTRKRVKEEDNHDHEHDNDSGTDDQDENSTSMDEIQNRPKTKYQNRYEPEVPMTKEQAAEWRREARRKRNRESAAASRNKIRNRINELEDEVQDWKDKYSSLLDRIDLLEHKHMNMHGLGPAVAVSNADGNQQLEPMQMQVRLQVQPAQGTGRAANNNQFVSPCTTPASSVNHPVITALDVADLNATLGDGLDFQLSMPSFDSQNQDQNANANLATARVATQDHDTDIPAANSDTANADTIQVPTPLEDATVTVTPNEFHVIETRSRPAQSNVHTLRSHSLYLEKKSWDHPGEKENAFPLFPSNPFNYLSAVKITGELMHGHFGQGVNVNASASSDRGNVKGNSMVRNGIDVDMKMYRSQHVADLGRGRRGLMVDYIWAGTPAPINTFVYGGNFNSDSSFSSLECEEDRGEDQVQVMRAVAVPAPAFEAFRANSLELDLDFDVIERDEIGMLVEEALFDIASD